MQRQRLSGTRWSPANDILVDLIRRLPPLLVIIPVVLLGVLARPAASRQAGDPPRSAALLFEQACSGCHNGDDPRAPTTAALRGRSPQAILDALTAGPMRYQGLALSGDERRALAEYLSGRKLRGTVTGVTTGACTTRPPFSDPATSPLWNGWGATLENTHFQAAPQAGLTADQIPHLHLKWAFGFPDTTSAWAQPTVAGGRLFVGSQNGTVYALDAATGCSLWTFAAKAGVRASIVVGPRIRAGRSAAYPAYVADQQGFVYAL